MKKFGETLGFLIALDGVAGLIYEWVGWFRPWVLVRYIDALDGYRIVANIVLIVVGAVIAILADQHLEDS